MECAYDLFTRFEVLSDKIQASQRHHDERPRYRTRYKKRLWRHHRRGPVIYHDTRGVADCVTGQNVSAGATA